MPFYLSLPLYKVTCRLWMPKRIPCHLEYKCEPITVIDNSMVFIVHTYAQHSSLEPRCHEPLPFDGSASLPGPHSRAVFRNLRMVLPRD